MRATPELLALREALAEGDYDPEDYRLCYCGTREQLIAAGLAENGMFPGDPGRNKTQQTFAEDQDGWSCMIMKGGGQGRFRIRLYNKQRRDEACRALSAQQRAEELAKVGQARREAEAEIAKLPKRGADYLDQTAIMFGCFVRDLLRPALIGQQSSLFRLMGYAVGGCRIDDQSLREFDEKLTELVSVIRSARAIPDRESRAREEVRLRHKAIPRTGRSPSSCARWPAIPPLDLAATLSALTRGRRRSGPFFVLGPDRPVSGR